MTPGGYIALSYGHVALATLLILLNGALSLLLGLGLGQKLLVASARAAVQLFLVGSVLHWVFAQRGPWVVVSILVPMTLIAGVAAVRRTERRFRGVWLASVLSVWVSTWLVAIYAILVVVRPDPWYLPQYVVPLAGLILGNSLTGISLGLERLGEELLARRAEVEALLALGATRWEAAREPVRLAVRAGMIPMLNTMTVAGIVSLPGTMTGQLIAGVAPAEAVKYQVVIMFTLAAGTALGTASVVLLSYRLLFSPDHQFLHARISERLR